MRVRRVPSEASAADRVRWLGDLAEALGQAQRLTWRIGLSDANPEAMQLYGRIEAAIAEVQALRLGRRSAPFAEIDPQWIDRLPWSIGKPAPPV